MQMTFIELLRSGKEGIWGNLCITGWESWEMPAGTLQMILLFSTSSLPSSYLRACISETKWISSMLMYWYCTGTVLLLPYCTQHKCICVLPQPLQAWLPQQESISLKTWATTRSAGLCLVHLQSSNRLHMGHLRTFYHRAPGFWGTWEEQAYVWADQCL